MRERSVQRNTRKTCKGIGGNGGFNVRYNATSVHGQQLTRIQTAKVPRISVPRVNTYYTLVMYDNDAPEAAYVHWYIPNIMRGVFHPVLPYEPPNPPRSDRHYHIYTIDLYAQPGVLDVDSLPRTGFNVDSFARERRLVRVGRHQYYIVPNGK